MALTFGGATSDRVAHGTGANLGTAFSVLIWEYPTSDTGPQVHWWKTTTGPVGRHNFERKFGDPDDYDALIDRATTAGTTTTVGVNRPLNAWKFVALTFTDGDGGARIYHGSLTANAVEASYFARSEGTGAVSSTSGTAMYFGNNSSFNEAFVGRIAVVAVFNRKLTLNELIEWQWRPHKSNGCLLFTHYGYNGTGTQPDWSGNGNSGTVTGATVSDHVPLGPVFAVPEHGLSYAVAAAAGGIVKRLMMMGVGV